MRREYSVQAGPCSADPQLTHSLHKQCASISKQRLYNFPVFTCLRTLAPASPLFLNASQKHPGGWGYSVANSSFSNWNGVAGTSGRRGPSTPRPDAPEFGAEEKIGPLRSLRLAQGRRDNSGGRRNDG